MSELLTGGTLTPAMGRDYKSKGQVIADLNAGLDFTYNSYNGSGYVSIADLDTGTFQVRDRSCRKLWVVSIRDHVAK